MKKCNKLGNRATKAERAEAHRMKMEMKEAMYEHRRQEALEEPVWLFANVGQNHPDYGLTPQAHEENKNNS